MKNKNWAAVAAAGDYQKLPVGWYVLKITHVEDVPKSEYLKVTWDVAEGEYAGHYAKDEAWRHTTNWSYTDKAEGIFKRNLDALEASNPNSFTTAVWQKESNEQEFVGLVFGAAIQDRHYTNNQGEDKTALEVARVLAADKARENAASGAELPAPRDQRVKVEDTATASVYDDDVPFS